MTDSLDPQNTTDDSTPKDYWNGQPKIGLALGGGLARGFAHLGAIRTLERYGIIPDIVTGTSIGALVGGCYLADKLEELEDWALSLNRKKIFSYMDFRVRSAGLIGGTRLMAEMRKHLKDIGIRDLPKPFISVGTDLANGHEVWMRHGDLVDSIRASFALPGIFPPVEYEGRFLIDGSLVNPVPVAPARAMGTRLVIAIDLNADLIARATKPGEAYQTVMGFDVLGGDVENTGNILNKIPITRRLFRREDTHHPSIFGVMLSTLHITQDRITRSRLAGDPPDVIIRPRIGHIGLLEFERAEEMIAEGEAAVERALPELMAAKEVFLSE